MTDKEQEIKENRLKELITRRDLIVSWINKQVGTQSTSYDPNELSLINKEILGISKELGLPY